MTAGEEADSPVGVNERSCCRVQVFCRPSQTEELDVAAAFIQLEMIDDSLSIQQLIINPMNSNIDDGPVAKAA